MRSMPGLGRLTDQLAAVSCKGPRRAEDGEYTDEQVEARAGHEAGIARPARRRLRQQRRAALEQFVGCVRLLDEVGVGLLEQLSEHFGVVESAGEQHRGVG